MNSNRAILLRSILIFLALFAGAYFFIATYGNSNLESELELPLAEPVELTQEEIEWIDAHRAITYSGDKNWLPYEGVNRDGKHIGIVADYIDKIEELTGLKFKYIYSSTWSDTIGRAYSGKIDITAAIINPQRERYLQFTKPFINNEIVIIMRESSYIENLQSIADKKIAVVRNYGYIPELRKAYKNINFIEVDDIDDGLSAVSSGKYDALLGSFALSTFTIAEKGLYNLNIVGKIPIAIEIGFAVSKEQNLFLSILNKALLKIDENTHHSIVDRWIKDKYVEKIDYKLFGGIFFSALFIVLIFVSWNRKLVSEISEKEEAQKSLKESQTRLELALKGGDLGFWDIDYTSNKIIISDRCADIIGYTLDDLEDIDITYEAWASTIHPDDRKMVIDFGNRYKRGEVPNYEIEYRVVTKDGGVVWVIAKGAIVDRDSDGKALRMVGTVGDITIKKQHEVELEIAKERAEAATQAKSEFLANMSHEIRTPMNAVMGFTELIESTELNLKQQSYLASIKTGAKGLLTIINDILDLSKIEAGKLNLEYESTNLYNLFYDVEQIFSQSVKEKGLEFKVKIDSEFPQLLILDQTRVRQILFNLIGNAIKFTEKGSIVVHIGGRLKEKEGLEQKIDLEIKVTDSGIGIPKEQQKHIFNKFEQTDGQSNRKYGGTGLGLPISQKLASMMNGKVGLQSKNGIGSTFTLYLFDVKAASMSDNEVKQNEIFENIEFNSATLLIVDDIADNRTLIAEHFNISALEFIYAENGKIAIEKAKEHTPDLILMDIRMPVMDGYEAIKIIKENSSLKNTPIIALTASVHEEKNGELEKAGFSEILRKPVQKIELIEVFSKYLTYSKGEDSREVASSQIELSPEVTENRSRIIAILEDELKDEYEQALNSGIISNISRFAQSLDEVGREFNYEYLIEYAAELKEYIEVFDIENIQSILSRYKEVIFILKEE